MGIVESELEAELFSFPEKVFLAIFNSFNSIVVRIKSKIVNYLTEQ